MGCWIYAQNHNENFPDSLDQLVADKHITSDVIKAPDGSDLFVYIKLTAEQWKNDPSRTVMLYEKFNAWPARGISVGFVDGHVEIINDQKAFEELLEPKPATKGNPGGLSK
jgi:prepilin-type processing-associated H-X9-DG protein